MEEEEGKGDNGGRGSLNQAGSSQTLFLVGGRELEGTFVPLTSRKVRRD